MTKLSTLYKVNSRGSLQEWTIAFGEDNGFGYYEVEWGQMGGKLQKERTVIEKGKNIGKVNETTPAQQAENEARSMWTKKQERSGYSTYLPSGKQFRPMLAKSYNNPGPDLSSLKDGKHVSFPCYYQPKLDGIRCTAEKMSPGFVRLQSRQGKEFTSLSQIQKDLVAQLPQVCGLKFDGELYVHGDEFQDLVSAIKRDKPSASSHLVEYHIYDLYDPNNPEYTFEDRYSLLQDTLQVSDSIKLVKTITLRNQDEVEQTLLDNCNLGYEGIMLRNKEGVYKVDGRSKDLQKVKLFRDEEFVIVGAEENKGKLKGTATFICETSDGAQFKCIPEGSHEQRTEYWDKRDECIGKYLTVRFFSVTTSAKPVPRFPIGVSIRDYE